MSSVGRLHVITHAAAGAPGHLELAALALSGGADTVQFREKGPMPLEQRMELAHALRAMTRKATAALIINDHLGPAVACGADGVHLGRDDASVARARSELGREAVIGGTANSFEEAVRVSESDVDYLGVGPVFGTRSKQNPAPTLGTPELAKIVRAVAKPVIAIGNITALTLPEVLDTGAHGIAVLSAVVLANDPEDATRALDRILASHARRSA